MESYESTENALMDSFKAAALKVTTLYKDSLVQNRKAYAAGYQQALQDLYEFISVQPENRLIPVQDVLNFARNKSNQLASQMNGGLSINNNNSHNNVTSNNHSSLTTTGNHNTSRSALEEQQQHQKVSQNQATSNTIFQIDPLTQFTFTHEVPTTCNMRNMDDLWHQATTTFVNNEGSKRRLSPSEFNFMGRSLNSSIWHEPPSKRGKSRREEIQQLQFQQQQQQFQQQQQEQQLQQHFLQQQQHL